MRTLIIFALVGFGAQLVDGALGMAYGVTSTSLLLIAGVNPATASASVHLAEVGTTLVAGASHWRFGNVDWKLVLRLGVPGAIGAFLGATALSALSTENAAPYMAGVLLALGVYVLLRFSIRPPKVATARVSPHGSKFLSPLGLVAGFVDASGGGGWGPVATPALLTAGRTAPRTVIGSVDTSEFLVALAASVGFLIGLGSSVLDPWTIGGLLLGGVLAAPLAAWTARRPGPPATSYGRSERLRGPYDVAGVGAGHRIRRHARATSVVIRVPAVPTITRVTGAEVASSSSPPPR
jgi:uncharacterized membrane protein YfcA